MTKRLILAAALLTAVIMAAYVAWTAQSNLAVARPAANSSAGSSRVDAPAQLGALKRVETKTGPDALAEFTRLHGKGFDLAGGYMAQYQSGDARATLWVAQARDALHALWGRSP